MKILIVEKEPILLAVLDNQFRKMGFEVLGAVDGEQGLDFIRTEKVDLVISNLLMPFANGFELLYEIREVQDNEMPVIILEDMSTEKVIVEVFQQGASDFVAKPVQLQALAARVMRFLPAIVEQNNQLKVA